MKHENIELKIDRLSEKLDEKLDKINDRLGETEKAIIRNTDSLEIHMMRTELAEQRLELIEEEIKPVLQGVGFLKTVAKIGSFLAGILYSISNIFK